MLTLSLLVLNLTSSQPRDVCIAQQHLDSRALNIEVMHTVQSNVQQVKTNRLHARKDCGTHRHSTKSKLWHTTSCMQVRELNNA